MIPPSILKITWQYLREFIILMSPSKKIKLRFLSMNLLGKEAILAKSLMLNLLRTWSKFLESAPGMVRA
jgi:hypothetical protein